MEIVVISYYFIEDRNFICWPLISCPERALTFFNPAPVKINFPYSCSMITPSCFKYNRHNSIPCRDVCLWSEQIASQLNLVEQLGVVCILNMLLVVTDIKSLVTTALIIEPVWGLLLYLKISHLCHVAFVSKSSVKYYLQMGLHCEICLWLKLCKYPNNYRSSF